MDSRSASRPRWCPVTGADRRAVSLEEKCKTIWLEGCASKGITVPEKSKDRTAHAVWQKWLAMRRDSMEMDSIYSQVCSAPSVVIVRIRLTHEFKNYQVEKSLKSGEGPDDIWPNCGKFWTETKGQKVVDGKTGRKRGSFPLSLPVFLRFRSFFKVSIEISTSLSNF